MALTLNGLQFDSLVYAVTASGSTTVAVMQLGV